MPFAISGVIVPADSSCESAASPWSGRGSAGRLGLPVFYFSDLESELAHEHHERIEDAHDAAEEAKEAAEEAQATAEVALTTTPHHEHTEYAPLIHEHPAYVSHDELESRLASLHAEASDTAEDAANTAEEAAEDTADELPLPEPDPVPEVRYERRHGRTRRV